MLLKSKAEICKGKTSKLKKKLKAEILRDNKGDN